MLDSCSIRAQLQKEKKKLESAISIAVCEFLHKTVLQCCFCDTTLPLSVLIPFYFSFSWCFLFSLHMKCFCWPRFHLSQPLLFSLKHETLCVTLPIPMLLSVCHTGGCQLCSCSPQFSLDLQTYVAKCLLGGSTWWMSHRHFQCSMSESSLCFFL